jgi:vacuolar-type H+-ATPase subunit F/Vma7
MSHLLILTRPSLVSGFRLAGVEAHAAEDARAAERLIGQWLEAGETGLLAVDEGLLAACDPAFRRRLEAAEYLPHIALPSGEPLGPEAFGPKQIAEIIRRAIGFHVTFRGEAANPAGVYQA